MVITYTVQTKPARLKSGLRMFESKCAWPHDAAKRAQTFCFPSTSTPPQDFGPFTVYQELKEIDTLVRVKIWMATQKELRRAQRRSNTPSAISLLLQPRQPQL